MSKPHMKWGMIVFLRTTGHVLSVCAVGIMGIVISGWFSARDMDQAAGLAGLLTLIATPLWHFANLFIRCPRCRKYTFDRPTGDYKLIGGIPEDCPRCGRTRRGVKMFQYLRRPEPGDGVRRDEPWLK